MKNVITIMNRELRAYFSSPLAYVIMTCFLGIVGLFFVTYVLIYSQWSMQASMNPMGAGPGSLDEIVIRNLYSTFAVIMIFMAPILSMRLLAEERRLRTAELLLTAPVTTFQLVLGKYLGVLSFAGFMLLLTLQYPAYLMLMGGSPELGPLASIYLGALLMTGSVLAIGMLSSSLTSNQIVSAVLAFVISLFFWLIGSFGEVGAGEYAELLSGISIISHYQDFMKGVVDTGSVVYYLTYIGFGLFLTQRVIDSGRWR
jgi:ABC-2 type transport system permease protein